MPNFNLKTSLSELPGVGPQTAERFYHLGVKTAGDLFELLPFRVEDRTQIRLISELQPDEDVVIGGRVIRVGSRTSKRGALIIQAQIEDSSGKIQAVWFNQRYLLKVLGEGGSVLLYGSKRIVPSMGNPFFVKKIIPRMEMAPIYPATTGLSQFAITRLLEAVRPLVGQIKDVVPPTFLTDSGLPSRRVALDQAHFAPSEQSIATARALLGFEEIFLLCLQALRAKRERVKDQIEPLTVDAKTILQAKKVLPFHLTAGQDQALEEVLADLKKPYPMNRLMYGEVGSGKTAIALLAGAILASNKKQTLWLSPTTALAAQQAATAKNFAKVLGLSVALVTGAVKDQTSGVDLVIGTHAILNRSADLKNVGLVIIDEQHRFGVDQRSLLLKDHPHAHLLMMTATPIPRSLAQTVFGHLDITYLEGKPTHQQPVKTYVFADKDRPKIEEHIRERLKKNQPGYIICPLIDPAKEGQESLFANERKAVTTEVGHLQEAFPQSRIGVLHGRLKHADKEAILADFKNGRLDLLLSTSVVEVGIDNPAATWILIEEADRFGLSQLHQLRGRVGRGEKSSVCFLHNSLTTDLATERLKVLESSNDGLTIAEKDLSLRGPGNVAGSEQSGLPSLRYGDVTDSLTIKKAYALAQKVLDSGLDRYPIIKEELKRRLLTINELKIA